MNLMKVLALFTVLIDIGNTQYNGGCWTQYSHCQCPVRRDYVQCIDIGLTRLPQIDRSLTRIILWYNYISVITDNDISKITVGYIDLRSQQGIACVTDKTSSHRGIHIKGLCKVSMTD